MQEKIKHIIQRGKQENALEVDRQEMLALFHDTDKEFKLKNSLLDEIENLEQTEIPSAKIKKMFSRLWAKIEKNNAESNLKTRTLNSFIKIAAAVTFGLFIGIYISYIKSKPESGYFVSHAPKGSVSEMILPDGSVVFLNSDSKVKYSIDGKNGIREVFLEGEAWFDVKKNKKKPFVVHTPFYDINVTGTKFNVKAYETDNETTTTLEEGQVIISSNENHYLAEDIVLKPGEQVVLNKATNRISKKTVNTKWVSAWKDNKLIFVNMSLKDLIVVLERKYGVDIEVKNKEILDLHFDGTIKNETIIEILEIIKKTLPVNYKIVEQHIEITNNKTKR